MLKKVLGYVLSSVILVSGIMIPSKSVNAGTATDITLKYKPHVQNIGWFNSYLVNGQVAGTSGQNLRLEALQFDLQSSIQGVKVLVQTHVQNLGWSDWVDSSQIAGSVGKGLRLEAIRIKLVGAPANYHVQYQAHVQDIGWQNWVEDGETSGTTGLSKRVEAIKINIINSPSSEFKDQNSNNVDLRYDSQVQNIGWTPYVRNGETTGTVGQGLRVEGLNINLVNAPANMKVKYQAHVQNIGWQPWKENGQFAGTAGQSLRIEALRISLENAPEGYHVQYQAHVQNLGWQNWAEDGDIAGTTGQSLRIEALRIVITNEGVPNIEETVQTNIPTTFSNFLDKHTAEVDWKGNLQDRNSVSAYSDPSNLDAKRFQFLRIDTYRELQSVEQLNAALVGMGVFEGKGQAFIDAAKEFNIDPIYLVSHAMWETGRGTSSLANGVTVTQFQGQPVQKTVVYNFFGIGAVDDNAIGAGAATAYANGWDSPEKAIRGGALWINSHYIRRSGFAQPSVYYMRWDTKGFWHEYATDVNWPNGIAGFMKQFSTLYKGQKLTFDIPVFQQ